MAKKKLWLPTNLLDVLGMSFAPVATGSDESVIVTVCKGMRVSARTPRGSTLDESLTVGVAAPESSTPDESLTVNIT
jgi:hypothetical protein